MMAPEIINALNNDKAAQAKHFHHVPYTVWQSDIDKWKTGEGLPIPFPHLGDYVPPGYALDGKSWMIDTSGFGADDEMALTYSQMLNKLEAGKAYAFIETGQFQAYLQPFTKG